MRYIRAAHILGLIIPFLVVNSCYDKDLANISETVYYSPEFSFPIGKRDVLLEEVIDNLDVNLTPVPDPELIPETIPTFIYDSTTYINPDVLEYTSIEAFDFNSISSNLEHVISIMLRPNGRNELPGKLEVLVEFLNDNHQLITGLCDDCVVMIDAAEYNEEGELINHGILSKHDISFSEEEINTMDLVQYIRINAKLYVNEISNLDFIFLPDQRFNIQLGLRVKFDIPLHEL